MAEDALGTVIVEAHPDHQASAPDRPIVTTPRSALSAIELARRLVADPQGVAVGAAADSSTDKNGSRSTRAIRPQQLYGKWLDAWCHLRNAQRDFTVANIEAVGPTH